MLELIKRIQLDIMLSLSSICAIIAFFIVMTGMNTRKKKALFLMEVGAAILLMSARLTWIYNGQTTKLAFWMSKINNFLDFFAVIIVLFAFNLYLKEMFVEAEGLTTNLKRFKINDILMALDSICIIISPFTGLYYYLDENNTYHRGPAIGVCFAMPLIVLIIQISLIVQFYKRLSKSMRLSVLLFVFTPFPATIAQFIFYGLETTNITIVAMAVLLYIFDLADINKTAVMSLRAIAANEAKSAFLSNMSHEIRTPINAVLGMNEMILRESDDPAILSYSENIKTAGSTLLGIINDILDFSKIEAGKIEIIPVDYDLSSLIHDLVNMIYTRTDAKGLELKLDIDRTIPKLLNGDEIRIKQVITNILTNAVKYTEKGSVTFQLKWEKSMTVDKDKVMLKVAVIDTGIGIKEEDMEKLFSKFDRIEEKRNRKIEGTGLGMSITKSLLEMMGAELKVESEYGKGSTFYFLLEQKVVAWDELGDYEQSHREQLKNRGKYKEKLKAPDARILVVDDNSLNLAVFKSLVKQTLIQTDTAESGDEGLELAARIKYDMIFLDHMMPGKDGIETLKELKAHSGNPNINVPVICLTANAISGAREQYISAGFVDYLTKPVDPDHLEDMLIKYLPDEKIKKDTGDEERGEHKEVPVIANEGNLPGLPDEFKPLAKQDKIDVSEGIRNNGSPEAYMMILKMLYDSFDDKLNEINGFYEDENIDDYTIKVHALKSSLRVVGAAAIGEEAQSLENAGKKDDIAFIKEHHEGFVNNVRSLKEILTGVFEPVDESDKAGAQIPEEKPVVMKREADQYLMDMVFAELKTAAENCDEETIQGIIGEMEDYSIPKAYATMWDELMIAVKSSDYAKITEL